MSDELRPAFEPIRTRGNQFWRGDERFLVKGINYFKYQRAQETETRSRRRTSAPRDALADGLLHELHEDVSLMRELGLNTILVSHIDPAQDHQEALNLLAENGVYVVVQIGDFARGASQPRPAVDDDNVELEAYYTEDFAAHQLRIIDALADYVNVLGLMVAGDRIDRPALTKFAPVPRALVRDAKAFIRVRGGRIVPVGISNPSVMNLRRAALQYFTAGSPEERVDFFAPQDYSWCSLSNFQISGWKHTLANMESRGVCVPMFLAESGANVNSRLWDEMACLYGEDMLRVYSGGCVYCFEEFGNMYGVVERDENGRVTRRRDFEPLKTQLRRASNRASIAMQGIEPKDYDVWRGGFPSETRFEPWKASSALPSCPVDMSSVMKGHEDDEAWVLVDQVGAVNLENAILNDV